MSPNHTSVCKAHGGQGVIPLLQSHRWRRLKLGCWVHRDIWDWCHWQSSQKTIYSDFKVSLLLWKCCFTGSAKRENKKMKTCASLSLKRFKAYFCCCNDGHVIVVLPLKSWMSTRMSRYLLHVSRKLGSNLLALMLPGTLGLGPESAWKKSGLSGTQKKIQLPASWCFVSSWCCPSGYNWTHWIPCYLGRITHIINSGFDQ